MNTMEHSFKNGHYDTIFPTILIEQVSHHSKNLNMLKKEKGEKLTCI